MAGWTPFCVVLITHFFIIHGESNFCGGQLEVGFGTFTTTKDDNLSLQSGIQCTWELVAIDPNKVLVTFTEINMPLKNCSVENVTIVELGVNTKIGILCGMETNSAIMSTGSGMRVLFHSNNPRSSNPFLAIFRPHTCGGLLTNREGAFWSPLYPDRYPLNSDCQWTISSPEAGLRLTFQSFHVGVSSCTFEKVEIYEGEDRSAPLMDILCGSQNGRTYTTSGTKMHIVFRANQWTQRAIGFYAVYKVIVNDANLTTRTNVEEGDFDQDEGRNSTEVESDLKTQFLILPEDSSQTYNTTSNSITDVKEHSETATNLSIDLDKRTHLSRVDQESQSNSEVELAPELAGDHRQIFTTTGSLATLEMTTTPDDPADSKISGSDESTNGPITGVSKKWTDHPVADEKLANVDNSRVVSQYSTTHLFENEIEMDSNSDSVNINNKQYHNRHIVQHEINTLVKSEETPSDLNSNVAPMIDQTQVTSSGTHNETLDQRTMTDTVPTIHPSNEILLQSTVTHKVITNESPSDHMDSAEPAMTSNFAETKKSPATDFTNDLINDDETEHSNETATLLMITSGQARADILMNETEKEVASENASSAPIQSENGVHQDMQEKANSIQMENVESMSIEHIDPPVDSLPGPRANSSENSIPDIDHPQHVSAEPVVERVGYSEVAESEHGTTESQVPGGKTTSMNKPNDSDGEDKNQSVASDRLNYQETDENDHEVVTDGGQNSTTLLNGPAEQDKFTTRVNSSANESVTITTTTTTSKEFENKMEIGGQIGTYSEQPDHTQSMTLSSETVDKDDLMEKPAVLNYLSVSEIPEETQNQDKSVPNQKEAGTISIITSEISGKQTDSEIYAMTHKGYSTTNSPTDGESPTKMPQFIRKSILKTSQTTDSVGHPSDETDPKTEGNIDENAGAKETVYLNRNDKYHTTLATSDLEEAEFLSTVEYKQARAKFIFASVPTDLPVDNEPKPTQPSGKMTNAYNVSSEVGGDKSQLNSNIPLREQLILDFHDNQQGTFDFSDTTLEAKNNEENSGQILMETNGANSSLVDSLGIVITSINDETNTVNVSCNPPKEDTMKETDSDETQSNWNVNRSENEIPGPRDETNSGDQKVDQGNGANRNAIRIDESLDSHPARLEQPTTPSHLNPEDSSNTITEEHLFETEDEVIGENSLAPNMSNAPVTVNSEAAQSGSLTEQIQADKNQTNRTGLMDSSFGEKSKLPVTILENANVETIIFNGIEFTDTASEDDTNFGSNITQNGKQVFTEISTQENMPSTYSPNDSDNLSLLRKTMIIDQDKIDKIEPKDDQHADNNLKPESNGDQKPWDENLTATINQMNQPLLDENEASVTRISNGNDVIIDRFQDTTNKADVNPGALVADNVNPTTTANPEEQTSLLTGVPSHADELNIPEEASLEIENDNGPKTGQHTKEISSNGAISDTAHMQSMSTDSQNPMNHYSTNQNSLVYRKSGPDEKHPTAETIQPNTYQFEDSVSRVDQYAESGENTDEGNLAVTGPKREDISHPAQLDIFPNADLTREPIADDNQIKNATSEQHNLMQNNGNENEKVMVRSNLSPGMQPKSEVNQKSNGNQLSQINSSNNPFFLKNSEIRKGIDSQSNPDVRVTNEVENVPKRSSDFIGVNTYTRSASSVRVMNNSDLKTVRTNTPMRQNIAEIYPPSQQGYTKDTSNATPTSTISINHGSGEINNVHRLHVVASGEFRMSSTDYGHADRRTNIVGLLISISVFSFQSADI